MNTTPVPDCGVLSKALKNRAERGVRLESTSAISAGTKCPAPLGQVRGPTTVSSSVKQTKSTPSPRALSGTSCRRSYLPKRAV